MLESVQQFSNPVSYRHPNGAAIWVNLESDIAAAVVAQEGRSDDPAARLAGQPEPKASSVPKALSMNLQSFSGTVQKATVTGGNIRNDHLYVPLDFFPQDAIGGSNKSEAAARTISVAFVPATSVETDIDRTKRILRARSAVADFFERAGVEEGNAVAIREMAPYRYEIKKDSNG